MKYLVIFSFLSFLLFGCSKDGFLGVIDDKCEPTTVHTTYIGYQQGTQNYDIEICSDPGDCSVSVDVEIRYICANNVDDAKNNLLIEGCKQITLNSIPWNTIRIELIIRNQSGETLEKSHKNL